MKVLRKVVDFIEDKEIKLTVNPNQLYIANYLEIVRFDDHHIVIKYNIGTINITGQDLMISKLLTDEILITGSILKIEIEG